MASNPKISDDARYPRSRYHYCQNCGQSGKDAVLWPQTFTPYWLCEPCATSDNEWLNEGEIND